MFDKIFTKALEGFSAPSKQKEQTNLLRVSKMIVACMALVLAGIITMSISSEAQSRPSTLTVPVGAKVTVKWKNAPKKVTKSKVAWYSGTKKMKSNVANRKSQKYTSKKAATVKVSVKYKGKKKTTDVKKIKFVAVSKLGSISPANTTIKSGQTTTINWKGAPSGIDTSQVKWTVSDKNIATITPNGTSAKLSSAKKAGTVTVTLKYYGKTIGTAKVKVTDKADNSDSTTEDSTEQTTTEDTSTPYTAQHTYKVFEIRPEYTIYNNGEYYFYLKTDNQDRNNIANCHLDPSKTVCPVGVFTNSVGTIVADIETQKETIVFPNGFTDQVSSNRVDGGYVFSVMEPSVGTHTLVFYEKNPALGTATGDYTNPAHYAKVCEYTFTVVDYNTAYNAEVKRIADEAKASSTDFWEQCSKAASVIIRDYRYPKLGATTEHCGTKLNSKFLDCVDASSLMCSVVNELGATSTEKASDGTAHKFTKVTYNGVTKEYDATPGGGTEYTDEEMAALKVDFTKFQ